MHCQVNAWAIRIGVNLADAFENDLASNDHIADVIIGMWLGQFHQHQA